MLLSLRISKGMLVSDYYDFYENVELKIQHEMVSFTDVYYDIVNVVTKCIPFNGGAAQK